MSSYVAFSDFGKVNTISALNPTVSEVGAVVLSTHGNSATGEVFTCLDSTPGAQVWIGTSGTEVPGAQSILETNHPDLLLKYTLDSIANGVEEAKGQSGTDLGTAQGNVTSVAGKFGNAINFPASTGHHVTFSAASQLSTYQGPFTMVLWINTTVAQGTTGGGVLGRYDSTEVSGRGLLLNAVPLSGRIDLVMSSDGTSIEVNGGTTSEYNDGLWHMVTIKFDPLTLAELNMDNGAEVVVFNSNIPAQIHANPLAPFRIGRFNQVIETQWVGKMDNLRLFNRVLTPSELTALYNEV